MALISDFPDFAAAAEPSADDLNSAAEKFVGVLGGMLPTATVPTPGSVETENMVGSGAGFVNDQTAEPYSEFSVQFGTTDLDVGSAGGELEGQVGPLPMDVWLTGVVYRGASLKAGTITLSLGGVGLNAFDFDATALEWAWPVEYMIPAGAVLTASVVYDPAAPAEQFSLALALKALHAGGPVF